MSQKLTDAKSVRLDQWLHAARFYKTRALSAQAIKTGRVLLNGMRTKPAHGVKPGDCVSVRRDSLQTDVIVRILSTRRAAASITQTWYEETDASREAREARAEQLRIGAALSAGPKRRPDKKSRRQIIRFIRDKK
ncbi:MAG: S4 domain-containing protein [Pseudomonadota bacterium]